MRTVGKILVVAAWLAIGVYGIASGTSRIEWRFPGLYSVNRQNSQLELDDELQTDKLLYVLALFGPINLFCIWAVDGPLPAGVPVHMGLNPEAVSAGLAAGNCGYCK